MYVEVLPVDLKRALCCNPFACPVSRAIRRQMCRPKNDDYVIIDGLQVYFGDHAVSLPEDVVSWIGAFDDGETVEVPFQFELDVPSHITLEYVQGRLLALSTNSDHRHNDLRTLGEVIHQAAVQVSDLDQWGRAA